MKGIRLVQGAAATLAAIGMLLPPSVSAQDHPQVSRPVVSKVDGKLAADVVLQKSDFAGRVVDHQGTPLVGHEVVIKQGDKEIGKASTDEKGVFTLQNVKPGSYTATAGNTTGNFRVWSEKAAPPSAKGQALLVMGQNGARGQFGAIDPTLVLLTAAIIATLILVIVNLKKTNDIDDKIPATF